MTGHDAYWLANQGSLIGWAIELWVEGAIEDTEAAIADGDWPTAIETSLMSLLRLGYTFLMAEGYQFEHVESQTLAALAATGSFVLEEIETLPSPHGATEEQARQALERVRDVERRARALLPFDLPQVRSAEGYFPSVRVAREMAALRAELGMPPVDWVGFIHV